MFQYPQYQQLQRQLFQQYPTSQQFYPQQPQFLPQQQPQFLPQQQQRYRTQGPQFAQPQQFQQLNLHPAQFQQPQNPYGYTSRISYQGGFQPQVNMAPMQLPQQFASPQRGIGMRSPQQQVNRQLLSPLNSVGMISPTRPQSQYYPQQEYIQQQQQQQKLVQKQVPQPTQKPNAQARQNGPQSQTQIALPKNQNNKGGEDLEKRFADAIQRTKNIVDRYNVESQKNPQQPQTKQAPESPKEEEQQELEDLALQYEDGYIYRGQGYPPQTRHGLGVMKDLEGNEVYKGFWQDNFYHGEGCLNNIQQESVDTNIDYVNLASIGNAWAGYEGEFYQGKMHGQGVLFLTNNEKFTGLFQEGMPHGEGEFTTVDGDSVKGEWNQGILVQLQE